MESNVSGARNAGGATGPGPSTDDDMYRGAVQFDSADIHEVEALKFDSSEVLDSGDVLDDAALKFDSPDVVDEVALKFDGIDVDGSDEVVGSVVDTPGTDQDAEAGSVEGDDVAGPGATGWADPVSEAGAEASVLAGEDGSNSEGLGSEGVDSGDVTPGDAESTGSDSGDGAGSIPVGVRTRITSPRAGMFDLEPGGGAREVGDTQSDSDHGPTSAEHPRVVRPARSGRREAGSSGTNGGATEDLEWNYPVIIATAIVAVVLVVLVVVLVV